MQYNRLNDPNALLKLIKALEQRVSSVETRGTGPIGFVGSDGVELHIGVQPDGQAAIVPFVGDTTPPPIATSPDASAGPGFLTVTWDGLFLNSEAQPLDFEHLNVVGHKMVGGSSVLDVAVGIIRNPMDSCLVGTEVAAVGEEWQFSFVSEDYNGNLSAVSGRSASVTQKSFAADVLIDEALEGLQQDYINAQSAAASAQQAANDAQAAADAVADDLTATDEAVAAAQLKADQAFNNAASAAEAAGNAQESADGKGTNWFQPTAPAGTSHKVGDTWTDSDNGYKVHSWNGSIWQTTQDSALAQLTADSKGRTYTQNVAPPVEARLPQNLWIDTSAGVGLYVTKYWDATANAGAGAWVALKDADAKAAQDTADAKGETIYSPTEPAAAKRLPQNTWIDTSGGLNIQKRWDGNAWIVVVDSRIPSTAAAVTAVDSRVTGVSSTAGSLISTLDTKVTGVSAAASAEIDTVDSRVTSVSATASEEIGSVDSRVTSVSAAASGQINTVDSRVTGVSAAASAEATAKANAAATTAINAQAYSNNASFEDWTSTFPVGFSNWSSTPIKETSIIRKAPFAMRFNIPDAAQQSGVAFQSILAHAPNLEYFTVEVDLYLNSGALDGSGVILDWNGMTNNRAQIQFKDELPGAIVGRWYRVSKVLRRPTNSSGTWTSMGGYLMGQWSGHGTGAAKNIIFDWFNVRPSTVEEILAYNAPSDAQTKANTAQANATTAAQQATMLATAYSKNPSFDDWSGTIPDTYGAFGAITPTKDTTNKRIGAHGMKFTVPGTEDAGIDVTSPLSHMPNLQYVTVEIEFMLLSGTLSGAGVLLDWNGLASPNRALVKLTDLVPTPTLNKWHRVSAVVERRGGAGTWTLTKGWLMANWVELGAKTAKTIVYDWLNVRPSTAEEILSYKAPTTQYVDTAEADAIAAAALLDNKVNSSRTYINRGLSTVGITNISGPAPVVVDSATAMGGKALQKTGTGNGWWADTNGKQAFDPSALYRMQARIKVNTPPTAGGGTFYMGVQGYLADGTTLCNSVGSVSTSSQHYLKVTSFPASGQWVDYVAYFKGNSTGNASGTGTVFDPYKLHVNVRHFEPMVIMDYSNGNGVVELSQLSIEVVDTQASLDLAVQDTNNKLLTKTRTYYQNDKPTGGTYLHGDTWIDSNDGNKVYVYNSGSSDFIVAQDAAIDKALYSSFPTDIDTSATNKWLFTKYNKGTSASHTPQYSDIVGFAGTSSLVSDASSMATGQGEQYIGQLRTIVNVVSTKTVSLTATHDDGARIYVDGVSVYSSPVYTSNAAISFQLTAGWHVIDFMWAEQAGGDGWSAVSPLLSTQVTSMFAPVSLSSVAATANTAVTSANGKNKVIYSDQNASGTAGYSAGDTWFKRDPATGVVSAQWEFTTAWQPRTLSESVLGNISAGKIVADWLEAGFIKAGAIDATKLNVSMGGNNLVPNSSFEVDSDSNGLADSWAVWARGAGDAGRVFTNTRVAGLFPGSTWAQRVETTTATNTEQSSIQSTALFAISGGSKAVLSLYGRANSTQVFSISMRCENDAGAYMGDANFNATFTTTAQRFSGLVIIPAGTTKAKVTITTPAAPANGSWFEVDGVKAELGDILSAWSPLTSELLPGTISGNLLTADAINGKVITGATVQTEATANRGIKLTTAEFAGYDTNGVKNFSLTSSGSLTLKGALTTGSTITGSTVTGSTIQTEATTDRGIKLTTTELSGFDTNGVKNFSLTSAGALSLKGSITSGSTITGATITGGLFQTESTAARGIKIDTTEMAGYDASGTKNFSLTTGGTLALRGNLMSGSSISGASVSASGIYTNASPTAGVKLSDTGIKAYNGSGALSFHLDATTGLLEVPGLKANAITSTMISATAIDGKTITGATVQSEDTANRGIKLTSTELAGWDINGQKNFSLTSTGTLAIRGAIESGSTITGAAISGGTMTAATVQSEATADRGLKLTSTELAGWDTNGQKNFSLTSGGALYLRGEIKSGSTIEGAKITGTQGIETSTDATKGVKINNVGIKAYDAGNNLTFHLDATTGMLEVPGIKLNSLKGDRIETGSLTTDKLRVGDFTNWVVDPTMSGTGAIGGATYMTAASSPVSAGAPFTRIAKLTARDNFENPAQLRPVTPGDSFYVEAWVRADGTATSVANIGLNVISEDGTSQTWIPATNTPSSAANSTPAQGQAGWRRISGTVVVPQVIPSTTKPPVTARAWFQVDGTAPAGTTGWHITGWNTYRQADATTIENGSIKTQHITFGTLDGGVISAGSLTSAQIKAKSILADDLVISSTDNLVVEADFGNGGTSWDLGAAYKYIMADRGRGGLPALRIVGSTGEVQSRNLSNKIAVDPTNRYRATIWVRSTEALPIGKVKMYLRCYDSASPITPDFLALSNEAPLVANTWTPITGMVPVLPAGTLAVEVIVAAHNQTDTTWTEIDYVSLTRAMDAKLVVDGSITASSLAAESVQAKHLTANAITASALHADQIWGDSAWLTEIESSSVKLKSTSPSVSTGDTAVPDAIKWSTTNSEVTAQGLKVYNTIEQGLSRTFVEDQEIIQLGTFDEDFFAINKAGVPQITMNADGEMTTQHLTVGDVVGVDEAVPTKGRLLLNGEDIGATLRARPKGIAAWGQWQAAEMTNMPSLGSTGGDVGLFEIGWKPEGDGTEEAPHRMYNITMSPMLVTTSNVNTTTGSTIGLRLWMTTDGSRPAVGNGTIIGYQYVATKTNGFHTLHMPTKLVASSNGEHIRVLFSMYANCGADPYNAQNITMLVQDLGEYPAESGVTNNSGGSNGGTQNTVPSVPPKTVKTVEYGYTGVKSYLASNAHYNYNTSKAYQGTSPAGYGELKSMYTFNKNWHTMFPASTCTINDIWVYLYFEHWYYASGGMAEIRWHNSLTPPSTATGITSNGVNWGSGNNTGSWPRAAGKWVRLPSSHYQGAGNAFQSGSFKGFALVGTGYDSYGIANNCRIRIRYTS